MKPTPECKTDIFEYYVKMHKIFEDILFALFDVDVCLSDTLL